MTDAVASRWSPADYAANAAFVPALGAPVLALLDPQPGEAILDLGCGDGVLTERIVAAGAKAIGVDSSPDMVAAARQRGIDAHVADGQALEYDRQFDAVFSNAALHWMLDAAGVATGVHRALRPGGRFVGEMGGEGNIAILRAGIRAELIARGFQVPDADPQFYPSPEEFGRIYAAACFDDIEARLIPRETELPDGIVPWVLTFRAGWLDVVAVPDEERREIAEAVERRLEARLRRPDDSWFADYVRLRFTMRKSA